MADRVIRVFRALRNLSDLLQVCKYSPELFTALHIVHRGICHTQPFGGRGSHFSPVAERWVILSEITLVESRIFWIFSSAVWISSIRCSTVSPTLPNFSRVFSISSFCFSTEATEFSILSLARFVSSFNLLIISVMLAEAFLSVRKAGGFHRPPQQTLFRLPRHAQPQWKHLRQADLSGWKFQ